MRRMMVLAGAALGLVMCGPVLMAQSAGQPPAGKPGAGQGNSSGQVPAGASGASDNPFPGEATDVPIIPVDSGTGAAASSTPGQPTAEAESVAGGRVDPDGDPVRSPDAAGGGVDDGFSSSRMGLASMAAGPDIEATPGKSAKAKTREQVVKDNVDVGEFYLERKNWKAALLRFQDAFTLDSESADAVFGMAEAEDHLEMVDKAREHFELFLAYDAEGPHGKAARKALEQIEREHPLERGTPVAGGKVATPK